MKLITYHSLRDNIARWLSTSLSDNPALRTARRETTIEKRAALRVKRQIIIVANYTPEASSSEGCNQDRSCCRIRKNRHPLLFTSADCDKPIRFCQLMPQQEKRLRVHIKSMALDWEVSEILTYLGCRLLKTKDNFPRSPALGFRIRCLKVWKRCH